MHECLAMDDQIHKVGIPIFSRCDCCSSGDCANMNHVLAIGEFAERIWNICFVQVGMPIWLVCVGEFEWKADTVVQDVHLRVAS